jgi:hypothetical protein
MTRKVISKDEERLNIVILTNETLGIVAKGISRCDVNDNYNREFGIALADTKAWLKYYKKLSKYYTGKLKLTKAGEDWWITQLTISKNYADRRVIEYEKQYSIIIGG